MAENMFDGFDHTAVQGRGRGALGQGRVRDAATPGGAAMTAAREGRRGRRDSARCSRLDRRGGERGVDPDSDEAQALAQRHVEWLSGIPGTPGSGSAARRRSTCVGLGEMYVADDALRGELRRRGGRDVRARRAARLRASANLGSAAGQPARGAIPHAVGRAVVTVTRDLRRRCWRRRSGRRVPAEARKYDHRGHLLSRLGDRRLVGAVGCGRRRRGELRDAEQRERDVRPSARSAARRRACRCRRCRRAASRWRAR